MIRFKHLAVASSLLALAVIGPVRAGTISYTGYNVLNDQNVTLNDPALGIANEQGGSGQISYTGIADPLLTWCIDIKDDLLSAGSFTTGTFLDGSVGNAVNALLSHVTPTLGSNYDASSALQVAIWQTEYGPDLSVSAPGNVGALSSSYLANVANGVWAADPAMRVAVLSGGGTNQDQAYLTPAPVPEPVSLVLLGGALVGASIVGRAGQWRSWVRFGSAKGKLPRSEPQ